MRTPAGIPSLQRDRAAHQRRGPAIVAGRRGHGGGSATTLKVYAAWGPRPTRRPPASSRHHRSSSGWAAPTTAESAASALARPRPPGAPAAGSSTRCAGSSSADRDGHRAGVALPRMREPASKLARRMATARVRPAANCAFPAPDPGSGTCLDGRSRWWSSGEPTRVHRPSGDLCGCGGLKTGTRREISNR